MLKSFFDKFKLKNKKDDIENKNIENCNTDFWNNFDEQESLRIDSEKQKSDLESEEKLSLGLEFESGESSNEELDEKYENYYDEQEYKSEALSDDELDEYLSNLEKENLELKDSEIIKTEEYHIENEEKSEEKLDLEQSKDINLKNDEILSDIIDTEENNEKQSFFKKIYKGLDKTRKNITDKIDQLIHNYGKIDDDLFEELEETLITSDISVDASMKIIDSLKNELKLRKINDMSLVKSVLVEVIIKYLNTEQESIIDVERPTVIFVIGVNGAGKTTSIGKMAHLYKNRGKKVILAAADTFRAAAIDQLEEWAKRSGVDIVTKNEGSDPSSVIYDAIAIAKSKKADILICDTAGRLHNKVNLMNELQKMFRVINKEYGDANIEVLLVLDATTGQNAISQAKLFKEAAPITGLVLTKLDGSAKGGFVISIKNDLNIPVKFVGIGEKIDDLEMFNPTDFAKAIMGENI